MYIDEDSFLDWGNGPYWGRIKFVENPGMAFGMEIWGPYGKLILSLFRIIAVGFLIYFIRSLLASKASMGLLVSFSLILAGAIGNILDSAFYGLFFSASEIHINNVAEFLPDTGGYAGFLYGNVVDMFYFPIWEGNLPSWIPFFGGKYFKFFNPIFNVADVAISIGVISILLFQRSFFSNEKTKSVEEEIVDPNDKVAELENFNKDDSSVSNTANEKIDETKNESNTNSTSEDA